MSDIFFGAKIIDAAKPRGMTVTIVHDPARVWGHIELLPALVVLDLNCDAAKPLDLITRIKSDPATSAIPIIGFVSHIQTDLRQRAADLGCDAVVPRSVFSRDLPELLDRYAATNARS